MDTPQPTRRSFTSDWRIVLVLAAPIFALAMWYGLSNEYDDMALYTIVMFLGSWSVSGWAVHSFRKWQEWQANRRGDSKA